MPGRTPSPRAFRVAWAEASAPAWDISPRSSRLLRKSGRSRRGIVSTTCRCGTGANSFSLSQKAHRTEYLHHPPHLAGWRSGPCLAGATAELLTELARAGAEPCSPRLGSVGHRRPVEPLPGMATFCRKTGQENAPGLPDASEQPGTIRPSAKLFCPVPQPFSAIPSEAAGCGFRRGRSAETGEGHETDTAEHDCTIGSDSRLE